MKIYKTQAEIENDIRDNVLTVDGDVMFECSFCVSASLRIDGNINARNIDAWNIKARDIKARNIKARNINARNIDAGDINAWNINAGNIDARNINARNILYYAFCCVINSIICLSIKGERELHQPPICLDGELEIKAQGVNR